MSVRAVGGWALLANAALTLVLLIETTTSLGSDAVALITGELLIPLFIVGLLGIWAALPHTGRLGALGGVWCLGIAAGIAFVVRLVVLVNTGLAVEVAALCSAALGLLGGLLVGWVTIRSETFLPALGWALIASGVLNIVSGLFGGVVDTSVVGIIATLLQAGALGGYGWTLVRGLAPTSWPQHRSGVQIDGDQQRTS